MDTTHTRIDVRIPNPLFEEIEAIAIAKEEPIHHKSGRVTIAPTLLELLKIGLTHYSPEAMSRVEAKLAVDDEETELDKITERVLARITDERLEGLIRKALGQCSKWVGCRHD